MNAAYCELRLGQALRRSQSDNRTERAAGEALACYWRHQLRQYRAVRRIIVRDLSEPGDWRDVPVTTSDHRRAAA